MNTFQTTIASCLVAIAINTSPTMSTIFGDFRRGIWGAIGELSSEALGWISSLTSSEALGLVVASAVIVWLFTGNKKSV